jgi:hypothetical protein
MGGEHYVRRVEELDNRLDGKIGAGKWWSEKHHGLARRELLPLGAPGREKPRGGREEQHDRDTLVVSSSRRR